MFVPNESPRSPEARNDARSRARVLFVGEAVTSAHIGRPLVLAEGLDPGDYELHFACDPRARSLVSLPHVSWHPLRSVCNSRFVAALARGEPVYDLDTLRRYVHDDLELFRRVAPDLIVGDFRLSLSVSARVAEVPYAAVVNAYWSPHARPRMVVPDLPVTRRLGPRLGQLLFDALRPSVFARHSRPLNRLRREWGLPPLPADLVHSYSDADATLYADLPQLVPTFNRPPHHQYVGPLSWSPRVPLPAWWDGLPADRPLVFCYMGSSGTPALLGQILEALANLPLSVVAATSGNSTPTHIPANAYVAEQLPGDLVTRAASLVICNGGSLGMYQALAAGVPVLGLPTNLDQYLNMSYLQQAGAGRLLRSGKASASTIRRAALALLDDSAHREAAGALQRAMSGYRTRKRFAEFVAGAVPPRRVRCAPGRSEPSTVVPTPMFTLGASEIGGSGREEPDHEQTWNS